MAQNITLMGASYSAVPAVTLPKTGGGTASFTDVSDTTATAADVASGKYFYTAAGERTEGTASGGGGTVTITASTMSVDPSYRMYPPNATVVTDPDEPWVSTITIAEGGSFAWAFQMDPTGMLGCTGGVTYSSKTISGRPSAYLYLFTCTGDGTISC